MVLSDKSITRQLRELDKQLSILKIDKNSVCIVGSFVLSLHKIRKNRDLDIVILPAEKKRISKRKKAFNITKNIEVVGTNWASTINISDESIINNSQFYNMFSGFKIIKPEILFLVMLFRGREKNLKDIEFLEKYALKSKKWSWDLVREIIPKSKTHDFKIKKPEKKEIQNVIKLSKVVNQYLQNQISLKLSIASLLRSQYIKEKFSRYDIFLQYQILKELQSKKKEKLIKKSFKQEEIDEFIVLINSFKKYGFRNRYPIIISNDGFILDGVKRIACALYFEIPEIPIIIQRTKKKNIFDKKWIERNFGKNVSVKIESTKDKLFMKNGLWSWVMLWAPAEPWFDQIQKDLSKFTVIKWQKTVQLGKSLPNFMRIMYSMDDIQKWKIELKINAMQDFEPTSRIIALEFTSDKYRIKKDAPDYQSEMAVYLKKIIRKKYGRKIPKYFYDIVIHIGDNHEHNRKTYELLKKYNYFS